MTAIFFFFCKPFGPFLIFFREILSLIRESDVLVCMMKENAIGKDGEIAVSNRFSTFYLLSIKNKIK